MAVRKIMGAPGWMEQNRKDSTFEMDMGRFDNGISVGLD